MSRYFGNVGYVFTTETAPSVFAEQAVERPYKGDELTIYRRLEKGEGVNDNVEIGNQFSILADAYAYENFFAIRYLTWMGQCWKVTKVTVQRPRLLLDVGGLWNGRTPEL